jgi:hypothetical protein
MSALRSVQSSPLIWISSILLLGSANLFAAEGERRLIVQDSAGLVTLAASNAVTHGTGLRYEGATNKNCLGFWTQVEDWAEWQFNLKKPGLFDIELWQGCGREQGGSEVALEVGGERFEFTVEETGHFQIFLPRRLGQVRFLTPGNYSLAIKPQRKRATAIMDIRQVRLVPVAEPATPERPFPGKHSLWFGFERL